MGGVEINFEWPVAKSYRVDLPNIVVSGRRRTITDAEAEVAGGVAPDLIAVGETKLVRPLDLAAGLYLRLLEPKPLMEIVNWMAPIAGQLRGKSSRGERESLSI